MQLAGGNHLFESGGLAGSQPWAERQERTAGVPCMCVFSSASDVQPILSSNRLLNSAETGYWPTEVEMAGLVWVVKRVRHMIEAAVVFTDHLANPSIANQTKLTSSSTDKLNLRLVRASTYLSQFQLDVRYRPGKQHIIPNALSRLPAVQIPCRTYRGP